MITLDQLSAAFHSVEIQTAAGQALSIDGSGYLTANINGSVTVSATDLDIRDLTHVSDSVKIGDGVETANVNASNELQVRDDDANTLLGTIDADTSALAACASGTELQVDVVAALPAGANIIGKSYITDGTDDLAVNADGSINVNSTPGGYSSWQVTRTSVDTTAGGTELAATPLSNRVKIMIQNLGNDDLYLKEATGVTSSNGFLLPKGSSYEDLLDATSNIWAIAGSSSSSVAVVEYA